MSSHDNHLRAVRYRELALSEPDSAKAALLRMIADEAERGVLCTGNKTLAANKPPPIPKAISQNSR